MRLLPELLKTIGFAGQRVAVGRWARLVSEQMPQKSRMRLVRHQGTLQMAGRTVGVVEHHIAGLCRTNTCPVETALLDPEEEQTEVERVVVVSASLPVVAEVLAGS